MQDTSMTFPGSSGIFWPTELLSQGRIIVQIVNMVAMVEMKYASKQRLMAREFVFSLQRGIFLVKGYVWFNFL